MARSFQAPTPDELARHVLKRRLGIKRGEALVVESFPSSLPWATAFVRQARRMDARPLLLFEDERTYWDTIDSGHVDTIGTPPESEWALLEASDVYVYFWGPENHARRSRLPEAVAAKASAYNREWYDRARRAGLRGVRMEMAKVTPANARFYQIPFREWRNAILTATMRDPSDLKRPIERVSRALARGREVRLTAPGGTDITLALDHGPIRTFDGRCERPGPRRWRFSVMATVPSAVVGSRLKTSVAEGTIAANRPSYLGTGVAHGGTARFQGGHLVRLSFRAGGNAVRKEYAASSRGRDLVGFIEVGLDPALHGLPDLEDCEAGAVTLGLGTNTSWGGSNRTDFMTWLTVAGGRLTVDGQDVVRSGRVL